MTDGGVKRRTPANQASAGITSLGRTQPDRRAPARNTRDGLRNEALLIAALLVISAAPAYAPAFGRRGASVTQQIPACPSSLRGLKIPPATLTSPLSPCTSTPPIPAPPAPGGLKKTSIPQAGQSTTPTAPALRGLRQGMRVHGIHSTGQQWGRIVGTVSSSNNLSSLPSWLAGSLDVSGGEGLPQCAPDRGRQGVADPVRIPGLRLQLFLCLTPRGCQLPSHTMFHVPSNTAARAAVPAITTPPASTQASSEL